VDQVVSGAEKVYRVIMQDWFDIDCVGNDGTGTCAAGFDCADSSVGYVDGALQHQHTHCAAIRDDFNWWHTVNDESEDSGKLLLVDTAAVTADIHNGVKERLIQVR
jgi:hypothetical protein